MDSRFDPYVVQAWSVLRAPEDVLRMVYEAANELVIEGHETWHLSQFPMGEDDYVLAVTDAVTKEPLGLLVFTDRGNGSYEIQLGYVEPSSRRQGVFTMLWDDLRQAGPVEARVHAANRVARETVDRLGGAKIIVTGAEECAGYAGAS